LAAICEAFSSLYPEKDTLNKSTIHQLAKKFWDTEEFVCDKDTSSDKTDEIMAILISSSASDTTMCYGCKNSKLPSVLSCCVCDGIHVVSF
jgi:hypothetical protein